MRGNHLQPGPFQPIAHVPIGVPHASLVGMDKPVGVAFKGPRLAICVAGRGRGGKQGIQQGVTDRAGLDKEAKGGHGPVEFGVVL